MLHNTVLPDYASSDDTVMPVRVICADAAGRIGRPGIRWESKSAKATPRRKAAESVPTS